MNSNIRFRCTSRSCNVTILVNNKLNEIIKIKNCPHNHPPLKDNSIKLDIIRTAVKRKGTEDLHIKLKNYFKRNTSKWT
jgi:hypothetical protein